MKSIKKVISYKISYEQYLDLDIYKYKITSSSVFIKRISGYTNKNGIDNLLNGNNNIETFNYTLLTKEQLNLFRENPFFNAMIELRKSEKTSKNVLNAELYEIKSESHSILDINGNLMPTFISLNNPMYMINNRDFNLIEILDKISQDKRFKNLHEDNNYEIKKEIKNGIIISTIPYYNSENNKNEYINVGFIPTDKDWKKIMKFVKENNLINKKTGYISYLPQIILELGILGFDITKEKKFITKGLK